ncbi:MAG: pyridoxal-phosphate dependent enzyme [Bacteroidota bacterium]
MFTSYKELKSIHNKLKPFIHNTPVLTSNTFNTKSNCQAYFKCENFQKMGAFKMRGALNAILNLEESERAKGVTTHSSGNFAQAVSLSAKLIGIPATVIMPSTAPSVKKEAVRSYGARVIECEPNLKAREKTTMEFSNETGAVILHPSDQKEVIDGNASACMELLEEVPDLDIVITPVGGGGLLAGTALAAKAIRPSIEIYAGEPMAADDAYWSLKKGSIQPSLSPDTIADGLKTQLGENNFPIIQRYVKGIIRVEENEIIQAMKWIWQRMKIIIEPSSAVAVAAIWKENSHFNGKKTGIIISGGNVDFNNLPF